MGNAFGICLGKILELVASESTLECILLTVFYRLRICSIEKFLYQPGLTATAGFLGRGVLCFVKRALKKRACTIKRKRSLF